MLLLGHHSREEMVGHSSKPGLTFSYSPICTLQSYFSQFANAKARGMSSIIQITDSGFIVLSDQLLSSSSERVTYRISGSVIKY